MLSLQRILWKPERYLHVATALFILMLVNDLKAAIVWTIPTSVNANQSYNVSILESANQSSNPTVKLYRNGVLVNQGVIATGYSEQAPSASQSITYLATSSVSANSSKTVAVNGSSLPPQGAFDEIKSTVYQGQMGYVRGWAADPEFGTPVTRVDIFLDGVDIGNANLGQSRPDVEAAFSRYDYLYSGWSWSIPTASLSLGIHSVEMRFVDNQGNVTIKPTKTFTYANSTPTTSLAYSTFSNVYGAEITLTALTTDPGSELTAHYIEYLSPGSTTWVGSSPNWGYPGASYWTGGPADLHAMQARKILNASGTWNFRARGRDSGGRYSDYATLAVAVAPTAASDNDGIPDSWELAYGLNPTDPSDANADFDGDGLTNLQEYQQGKNPLVYDGPLWLSPPEFATPTGTLTIVEPTISSRTFSLPTLQQL